MLDQRWQLSEIWKNSWVSLIKVTKWLTEHVLVAGERLALKNILIILHEFGQFVNPDHEMVMTVSPLLLPRVGSQCTLLGHHCIVEHRGHKVRVAELHHAMVRDRRRKNAGRYFLLRKGWKSWGREVGTAEAWNVRPIWLFRLGIKGSNAAFDWLCLNIADSGANNVIFLLLFIKLLIPGHLVFEFVLVPQRSSVLFANFCIFCDFGHFPQSCRFSFNHFSKFSELVFMQVAFSYEIFVLSSIEKYQPLLIGIVSHHFVVVHPALIGVASCNENGHCVEIRKEWTALEGVELGREISEENDIAYLLGLGPTVHFFQRLRTKLGLAFKEKRAFLSVFIFINFLNLVFVHRIGVDFFLVHTDSEIAKIINYDFTI